MATSLLAKRNAPFLEMKVEVDQILHMVGGLGETSYAANSTLQEKAICRAKSVVQRSVTEVYCTLQPQSLISADLGCSSGPTTFMVVSEIMDAVHEICYKLSHDLPELMFFLNDLPGNDFTTVFKSLTAFKEEVREKKGDDDARFYVLGAPGSFYGRLFPKESVHFVHSSYSLTYLSQVPEGLEDDSGAPRNRRNIYISETSPPFVFESYLTQFQRDFSTFLKLRSEEIVSGGQMVFTLVGRGNLNPSSGVLNYTHGLLAEALYSLVDEGVVEEDKVDAFNLPCFEPAMEEVKAAVQNEGSFELEHVETFELNWDPFDDNVEDDFVADSHASGRNTSKIVRAALEPILASHFGESMMDSLFSRYALNVAEHLKKQKTRYVNFTFALKKKRGGSTGN